MRVIYGEYGPRTGRRQAQLESSWTPGRRTSWMALFEEAGKPDQRYKPGGQDQRHMVDGRNGLRMSRSFVNGWKRRTNYMKRLSFLSQRDYALADWRELTGGIVGCCGGAYPAAQSQQRIKGSWPMVVSRRFFYHYLLEYPTGDFDRAPRGRPGIHQARQKTVVELSRAAGKRFNFQSCGQVSWACPFDIVPGLRICMICFWKWCAKSKEATQFEAVNQVQPVFLSTKPDTTRPNPTQIRLAVDDSTPR